MREISFGNRSRTRPRTSCGDGLPALLIASIGTSAPNDPIAEEVGKARAAAACGADVVTDHSFYGDIDAAQRAIAGEVDVGLSAVTCYEFAARYKKRQWPALSEQTVVDLVGEQLDRGVDLLTVHASLTRSDVAFVDENERLIPTTSKGGGIVANYIRTTQRENPYFEAFESILELVAAAGAGISLGTTFRAASVCDGWDRLMRSELQVMGELVEIARGHDVPVMIEGFGHTPIQSIPTYIKLAKLLCAGAPYRVLPMATDRALGFDHISGAIAAAVAVANGANAVTAMSRAEHIGLPSQEDMEEAVAAARVAIECGQLATIGDFGREEQMARTRWAQGCKGDWTAAVNPRGAEAALRTHGRLDDQMVQCSMCGDYCGINAGIATVNLGPPRLRADD